MNKIFNIFDYIDHDIIKGGNITDDNGLLPGIWGPPTWESLHATTFGYPVYPTQIDKIRYKLYFRGLGYVLPCGTCRESYIQLITTNGNTALTDNVFDNRRSLTFWLYNLHNAINEKINVKHNITYEEVVKKYETNRATCKNQKCIKTPSVTQKTYKFVSN